MSNMQEAGKVAIYWDFENIHAILNDREYGDGDYVRNRYRPQEPMVEIEPVVDYAATIGDIVIHKAYCNWQFFGKYQKRLNTAGMDLIQIFPRGWNAKNGADINLALDALTDIQQHPHITHLVVVSNDTDFVSLAQKIKQSGRTIIGVGLPAANRFWQLSCNEFKRYDSLLAVSQELEPVQPAASFEGSAVAANPLTADGEKAPLSPRDNARSQLVRAVAQLTEQKGEGSIAKAAVKSLLKRIDPSFDEKSLGFETFTAFLTTFNDVVRVVDSQHVISAMVTTGGPLPVEPPLAEDATADDAPDSAERASLPIAGSSETVESISPEPPPAD